MLLGDISSTLWLPKKLRKIDCAHTYIPCAPHSFLKLREFSHVRVKKNLFPSARSIINTDKALQADYGFSWLVSQKPVLKAEHKLSLALPFLPTVISALGTAVWCPNIAQGSLETTEHLDFASVLSLPAKIAMSCFLSVSVLFTLT